MLAIRVWKAPLEIFSIAEGGGVYATPVIGDAETISLYERAITWHYIQRLALNDAIPSHTKAYFCVQVNIILIGKMWPGHDLSSGSTA